MLILDYIFIDLTQNSQSYNFNKLAKRLSNRNFGIGSDGLIVLTKSKNCDVKMLIFNSDGTKATMCGNATRCTAFYVSKILNKKNITIQSGNKILKANVISVQKNRAVVDVNMGKCKILNKISIKNKEGYIVDIGNKHCVIFVDNYKINFNKIIKNINYKNGINIEFVKIINSKSIQIKVYERGSGFTLACGSGACACAYLCYKLKKVKNNVTVKLDGGKLNIKIIKNNIHMLGDCEFVYYGEIN